MERTTGSKERKHKYEDKEISIFFSESCKDKIM